MHIGTRIADSFERWVSAAGRGEGDTYAQQDQDRARNALYPVSEGVEAALYGGRGDEEGDERAPAELDADDGQAW